MELLSIADISKKLNIPQSNLRYYRDKYLDYIPYVGTGKKRRYKAEAIEVFSRIAILTTEGKTANDIAILLSAENTKIIDIINETATTTTTTPQIDIFQVLSKQQHQIDDLIAHQKQLEQQLNNHYKLVDERLRQLNQPKEKVELKSFWQRLFG